MINRRTFNISNLNRSNPNVVNKVVCTLPDKIFSSKIQDITLNNFYIDHEYEILGNTNNQLYITFPPEGIKKSIIVDLSLNGTSSSIQTDDQLAALIADAINSTLGTTIFQATYAEHSNAEADFYHDNVKNIINYSIFTSTGEPFTMDFSNIDTIGSLIGFGTNKYSGESLYTGGNIPAISSYETIRIVNNAFSSYQNFDDASDRACKMNLYNSNGILIENLDNLQDTTISLPYHDAYIDNPGVYCKYIQVELNKYKSNFNDAEFKVSFDYSTYKFTISNSNNELFGIGFKFYKKINGTESNNYGSMHLFLGFEKKDYLNVTSITSIKPAKIFNNSYYNDYIMICSDLIENNFDASFITLGSINSYNFYDALFVIPAWSIINNNFTPSIMENYKTSINSSYLSKQYIENLDEIKTMTFYLKSTTGRHIKITSQWSANISIIY